MNAVKKVEKVSRDTVRAGAGLVVNGQSTATEQLDRFYVAANAFVNDLISRGETVEQELKSRLHKSFGVSQMLDEKIAALRAKLGMQTESREQQLEKLSDKVDNLIEVVAKLAQMKAAEQAASASAKTEAEKPAAKPATRTRKTTTTRKAAAPKAAATKPAAAKSTTTKSTASKAPAKPRTRRTTTKPADSE